jgi:beta-lactamase class A
MYKRVSKKKYRAANKVFFDDKRDTTTPRAMVDLLARMYQGKLVSASSTKFLVETMSNCHLFGKGRMVRLLPRGCKVLHKTGRLDGMVSDVGIIELPNNKGHVALALYSNRSTTHEAQRELAMAKVARAVYDYFS